MKLCRREIIRGLLIAAAVVWVAFAVAVRIVPLPRKLHAPPPLSLDLRDRNDLPLRQVLQGDKAQHERKFISNKNYDKLVQIRANRDPKSVFHSYLTNADTVLNKNDFDHE